MSKIIPPGEDLRRFREACRGYTDQALAEIADLMTHCENPSVRLKAAIELLDRGYGKPAQAVTGEGGEGPVRVENWVGLLSMRDTSVTLEQSVGIPEPSDHPQLPHEPEPFNPVSESLNAEKVSKTYDKS